MSPILVRPVREQLEHDRVIRLLQAKLKRKHEVAINVADDQAAGLKIGVGQMFPDLILTSTDKNHRLEGIIEVETGESVNHLEAMAQWAHFGRARAPFYLYVPAAAVDIARRLCAENQVTVSEIWSYHSLGDQTRFTMVHRSQVVPAKPAPAPPKPAAPAAKAAPANKAPANKEDRPAPKRPVPAAKKAVKRPAAKSAPKKKAAPAKKAKRK